MYIIIHWQLTPHSTSISLSSTLKKKKNYLELQENRMATVSKFTTKVHSWSPAGTKLGEMCWQTAKGNINWGGLEATSVGSVHNSKKGMVSSWTEKTTQYLEIKRLGFLVKTWWCSCCWAFLNEFQMVEIEKKKH